MNQRVALYRQVEWRARQWRPPRKRWGIEFMRQYPMRAGAHVFRPFPVDPWDLLPSGIVDSAPLDRAFYMAEVDEVDEAGNASLTLWESPSGRSLLGGLPPLAEGEREGPEPAPGDRLSIWTWNTLDSQGELRGRRFVRVERRELTDEEKDELLRIAHDIEARLARETEA